MSNKKKDYPIRIVFTIGQDRSHGLGNNPNKGDLIAAKIFGGLLVLIGAIAIVACFFIHDNNTVIALGVSGLVLGLVGAGFILEANTY